MVHPQGTRTAVAARLPRGFQPFRVLLGRRRAGRPVSGVAGGKVTNRHPYKASSTLSPIGLLGLLHGLVGGPILRKSIEQCWHSTRFNSDRKSDSAPPIQGV